MSSPVLDIFYKVLPVPSHSFDLSTIFLSVELARAHEFVDFPLHML